MEQIIVIPFTPVVSASGGAGTPVYFPVAIGAITDSGLSGYLPVEFFDEFEGQLQNAAATGGAGTPTLDCALEGSFDGTNWFTVKAFTQLATGSAGYGTTATIQRDIATTGAPFGRYHRLKLTAGSASGTATYPSGTIRCIYRSLGE